MEMRKYKISALIGTIIMGIGSFMACLCASTEARTAGNVLLILSIVILTYAFSKWQP